MVETQLYDGKKKKSTSEHIQISSFYLIFSFQSCNDNQIKMKKKGKQHPQILGEKKLPKSQKVRITTM